LFLNALDDPIVGRNAIDTSYELFAQNENIVLGITKHGGHLGFHESIFDL